MAYFEKRRDASSSRDPGINADVQAKIGHQLKTVYDSVLEEPVPERIAVLLRQLDKVACEPMKSRR